MTFVKYIKMSRLKTENVDKCRETLINELHNRVSNQPSHLQDMKLNHEMVTSIGSDRQMLYHVPGS